MLSQKLKAKDILIMKKQLTALDVEERSTNMRIKMSTNSMTRVILLFHVLMEMDIRVERRKQT